MITSGGLFGFHGDVAERENYFGTSKETLVLNVLGDDKEEHNALLRGIRGLFARKDFTVLTSPQRTPLVVENAIPDPEPDALTDWNANSLALVTAPWDALKTAAQTTSSGSFVHHIFSRRNTTRVFKAGETIKVTAKVAASNPARQFWISPHSRTPNAYPASPLASASPITAGAGWQTVSFTCVLTADIALGQADVALVSSAVPPASETMTMGDVTFESLSHPGRDNRSFNIAADFLRTGLFRAVGSPAVERINEKTARVTWILENIWGFYRSVSDFTTSQLLMTSNTMTWDFSATALGSNAPIDSGLLRIKGPVNSGGGFLRVADATSGKTIALKPTTNLLATEYVVIDIATLKANKVTTDSWATTGGTDWTARVEIGGEGSFSFEPGSPSVGFPDVGGFSYGGTAVLNSGSTATGVEFRFKRSYLS
jgi:hypothetical protein